MTQILIVDQKAMAQQAMAVLVQSMQQTAVVVQSIQADFASRKDLNRAQVRAFEARLRPLKQQMTRLQLKQKKLQEQIEALGVSEDAASA